MDMPYIHNKQDYLAEKFQMMDNHLVQSSKIAFLKIQSWKFALRTPEVGFRYLHETEEMVRQSLLSFVPGTFVLSEEGFYYSNLEN